MLSKGTAGGESGLASSGFGGSAFPAHHEVEGKLQLVVPAEVEVQAVDLAEGKAAVGLFSRAVSKSRYFSIVRVGWRFGSAKAWR